MLQLTASHAPMLHLIIMAALIHSSGNRRGITDDDHITRDIFRLRADLVQHLSIAMKDPVEATKDINILAASSLASKDLFPLDFPQVPSKTPKQGPLRELQLLSSCGLTESLNIHVEGLASLMKVKGGFDKIETRGVAIIISL